jgi:hypothetical protein
MTDNENGGGKSQSRFGSCCTELKEAIAGEDFEPLFTESPNGVLYMAVGLVELEEDEPGMVDHPMFFCPFCGTRLQTPDEVEAKAEPESEDQGR